MNKLQLLVIHCTATGPGREVSADDIRHWHTDPKPYGRGWSRVGYSDLIHLDGRIENLHEFDHDNWVDPGEITNGVRGFNGISRHICYVGGIDQKGEPSDTRTHAQYQTLKTYILHMIHRHPDILIAGHCDLARKPCPSFNVQLFLNSINVPTKNIYTKNQ